MTKNTSIPTMFATSFEGSNDEAHPINPVSTALQPGLRVTALVPLEANPPDRLPFSSSTFESFERDLAARCGTWHCDPTPTRGGWTSPTLGYVCDTLIRYSILVHTLEEADDTAARLYLLVATHFDQEHVLISVTSEPSTAFTSKETVLAGGVR